MYSDSDDFACIQIEDSGVGIDPEQYDKVLKRFYRVHHHLEVGRVWDFQLSIRQHSD